MVFLIQNTQNREAVAVQLKLDELIRSHRAAHNWLLDLEKLSESDLERMRRTFAKLAEKARAEDTTTGELQREEQNGRSRGGHGQMGSAACRDKGWQTV